MNFEDPFANDLSNFRSVAAGLQQGGASGGSPGGGPPVASPLASSRTTRGGLLGAGSPLMSGDGGGRSEASLFPSSSNAPAVAGRRARATPGAASPLSAAPSSVLQSLPSNTPASPSFSSPTPQQQLQQTVPATGAAASPLAWLDEVDPSPPPASRRTGLTPTSAPVAFTTAAPLPPVTLAQSAGAGAQASTALPSFLDFDAAEVGGGTAAPHQQPVAAAGQPQHRGTAVNVVDAALAEAEQRKKELRDLYATLDALDGEQQRLDERLDTRQLKEEAVLLALETSVMTKANELADKEEELTTKRMELTTQTASRLEALSKRYRSDTEAQAAEVRSLDGVRFEKMLQNVRSQCKAIDETVRGLREQAALAVAMEPFSATGIRVAIAAATSAQSANARPAAGGGVSEKEEEQRQQQEGVEAPVTSSSLDMGLHKAVELLRAYCDERMHHARSQIVDYVHCESLEAAHKVRRSREQSWADDAAAHKTLFSQYMVDMMQRYMVFYKERAALKQQNITSLQAELQSASAELRRRAAKRLQDLLTSVTAKMALSTERQTASAEDAKRVLHQRMRAIVETDVAAATAQRRELETRLLTEAQARRQRLVAEEHALLDELHRLRRTTETHTRDSFTQLLDTATSSGVDLAQALEDEVDAVKARVAERAHGDAASLSALRTASSTAHMHSEELLHVIRHSLAAETAQQHALTLSHQRCKELRSDLLLRLREDVVGKLQQARCAQHAHHMRIDAQRKTWEAAHRQNLAAACSLLLPVSGSTAGTADAQYAVETYAAPQDVVSVALLDVLRDRLQGRDDSRRHLLQARKAYTTRSLKLLEDVCRRRETVQHTWDEMWTAAQTQQAQQHMVHETQLAVETARVNVAAQQQAVERDRRTTARECRRIAEVVRRLHVEAAQCGVSVEELRAPPEVLEAKSMPFLRTVDAATLNRLSSSASKLTAVHTSTNTAVAHTTEPAVVPTAASTDPVNSPNVTTGASPLSPLPSPSSKGAATPVTTHPCSSVDVADASNVTATQPWSSALLQAGRLLSSNNADDLPFSIPLPSESPAPVVEEGHCGSRDGEAVYTARPERKSSSHIHSSGSNSNSSSALVQLRGVAASALPSAHTEQKKDGSPSSHGRDTASLFHMAVPPSSWLDTAPAQDTRPQQQQRQERRRPPSHATSPWQPPPPQGQSRSSALFETWSSLEEFRSAVGRSSSAPHELENREEGGTSLSSEESTNFVNLLSCADSPASPHRAC